MKVIARQATDAERANLEALLAQEPKLAEFERLDDLAADRIVHSRTNENMGTAGHAYEVRALKHGRRIDLISDVPPFGRLWCGEPNAAANAIGYAEHCSQFHDAVICVYDHAGNVIETHEHKGDFKEP